MISMATKRINRMRALEMAKRARQLFSEGMLSTADTNAVLKISTKCLNKMK